MNKLEIKNISKTFGSVRALDNVSFNIEEHKIYGLLGRNGAGKTTLLNIINNHLYPDQGEILLNGELVLENDRALNHFYFVSEKNLFPEGMTVKKIYQVTKQFFPAFDMEYALKISDLFKLPIKQKAVKLSTGYKSIYKNIVALSANTPFVFLDEPVLGLDANHRELFYKILIEKYIEKPFTVVLSTHLIEESANLIEHVVIIKNGQLIIDKPKDELLDEGYTVSGPSSAVDSYTAGKNVIGSDTLGGLKTAYIYGKRDNNIPDNIEITGLDLQKLFIQLSNE